MINYWIKKNSHQLREKLNFIRNHFYISIPYLAQFDCFKRIAAILSQYENGPQSIIIRNMNIDMKGIVDCVI